jgi:hypothetical protein
MTSEVKTVTSSHVASAVSEAGLAGQAGQGRDHARWSDSEDARSSSRLKSGLDSQVSIGRVGIELDGQYVVVELR